MVLVLTSVVVFPAGAYESVIASYVEAAVVPAAFLFGLVALRGKVRGLD